MDDEFTPYQLTEHDHSLLVKLTSYLRANPDWFQEAGRWLDAEFGRASELHEKAIRESRIAINNKRPANGDLTGGFFSYYRFETAWDETIANIRVRDRLKQQDRVQIETHFLLLVWLLTDPDAADVRPPLTEFQTWDWNQPGLELDDSFLDFDVPDNSWEKGPSRLYAQRALLQSEDIHIIAQLLEHMSALPRKNTHQGEKSPITRKAKKSRKGIGGAPRIGVKSKEGERRIEFAKGWLDAKDAGRTFTNYCDDMGVEKQAGHNYLQWCRDNGIDTTLRNQGYL